MTSSIIVTSGDDYGLNGSNDRRRVITVTKGGVAVDLTGIALTFMVKRRRTDDDADALIEKTTPTEITLASPQSGATKGVAYLTLLAADTEDLDGKYPYEIAGVDSVGAFTGGRGYFYVRADLVTA